MEKGNDAEQASAGKTLAHQTIKLKQLLDYLQDLAGLEYYMPSELLSARVTFDASLAYQYLVLDGPTGVGKSRLVSYVQNNQIGDHKWKPVRRATTRSRRKNETDDEIISVCDARFDILKDDNKLLYWEIYEGNNRKYGVLVSDLLRDLEKTIWILISNIAVSRIIPKCAYIYLVPPSLDELRRRMGKNERADIENVEDRMEYSLRELRGFVSSHSELVSRFCNVSVLCSYEDREAQCASKVWEIVSDGRQIIDLPNSLLTDLRLP